MTRHAMGMADGSGADKTALLEQINHALAEHGLPLWNIANMGDLSRGECEITDVRDVVSKGSQRVQVTFEFLAPDGTKATATVGFGGNVMYVVPVLALQHEGSDPAVPRVCLCKRWRVELGRWTYQVPHGLQAAVDATVAADALASPAHGVLERTFGAEFVESISAARVTPYGDFLVRGENAPVSSFLLVASVLKPFRRKKGDGAPVLLTWGEVLRLVDEGQVIKDANSVAVLLRAMRRFGFGAE